MLAAKGLLQRSPNPAKIVKTALRPCVTAIGQQCRWFTTPTAHHDTTTKESVILLGAAGRDFHDFITYWSKAPHVDVKCFTGTQIPGIDHRVFPPSMCNNDLNGNKYPDGLKIYPEECLEELVERYHVNTVALAYSDLKYDTVQSLAARANTAGCKFVQLPPQWTMVESKKPVIAICASRTGVGKSQTTRYVAKYFKDRGLRVAVVRHPMPYDQNLDAQRIQRYEKLEDMDKYHCTIEEREEYERHIEAGNLLFAGVDYPGILAEAEDDADIVIWDGGNNDLPFYKPDLHITLVDSLRPHDEEHYYPGETNVRMADVVLVTKVNELDGLSKAQKQKQHLKTLTKPNVPVLFAKSIVTGYAKDPATGEPLSYKDVAGLVKGKRVLVIDDGPTLTHGGMPFGAGYVLAENLGAADIIDPRPYAQGSLKQVFEKFPHLNKVLPAMGYSAEQIHDLEETIHAATDHCDAVIVGTPSDISHLLTIDKPTVGTQYELEMVPDHVTPFREILETYYDRFGEHHNAFHSHEESAA